MENEKYPYQNEWDTYREGNALGCLAIPVTIGLILLGKHFLPPLPGYVVGILTAGFFAFVIIYGFFDKGGWKCPRCKEDYDYRKRMKPTRKCINCGLPRYYGSTYFLDFWGKEKARELEQEVEINK